MSAALVWCVGESAPAGPRGRNARIQEKSRAAGAPASSARRGLLMPPRRGAPPGPPPRSWGPAAPDPQGGRRRAERQGDHADDGGRAPEPAQGRRVPGAGVEAARAVELGGVAQLAVDAREGPGGHQA
eukprot:CAMPEP_0179378404 /NCGR_PEP_ID=MMETSP0797-20121207/89316_1 /TAXON_ID=47934 /ORGANISM="Dinophysis acuminata, Strain DAEP01" /LENGTH=127 /DNA_ID=CAMNT_0021094471 /DNA_START=300 /DNA_END=681 /DNA_ORIENTATION=-